MKSAHSFRNNKSQSMPKDPVGANVGAYCNTPLQMLYVGLVIILMVAAPNLFAADNDTGPMVYDPEAMISLLVAHGEEVAISPDLHVRYFQDHRGARREDHVSSYVSLFGTPMLTVGGMMMMPFRLSFSREIWTKSDKNVWTIDQRIAADTDLDGRLDEYFCRVLEEEADGTVLSIHDKSCDRPAMAEQAKSMALFFLDPPRQL